MKIKILKKISKKLIPFGEPYLIKKEEHVLRHQEIPKTDIKTLEELALKQAPEKTYGVLLGKLDIISYYVPHSFDPNRELIIHTILPVQAYKKQEKTSDQNNILSKLELLVKEIQKEYLQADKDNLNSSLLSAGAPIARMFLCKSLIEKINAIYQTKYKLPEVEK